MAKKKEITYSHFQKYIKDKDLSVNHFIDNFLDKTQSMFVYGGLPETIPSEELERLLQVNGNCFITEVDGELYALRGALGGEPDPYERPTKYVVANVALKLSKEYDVQGDGVLVKNDYNMTGLMPLIGKYAVLLTDSTISLNTASILTRITMLISASDDKTKQSADLFLQKIMDGDFSVIGENAFFKGIQMQTAPTTNSVYVTQLIELVQYYKANLLNELGLNANYNMKRERLNANEVGMNIDVLLPFVDNMLNERKKAIEKVNEKYGTEITVDLSSAWKTTHEENDNELAEVETETGADSDTVETEKTTETVETTETDQNEEKTDETDQIEETEETIEKSDDEDVK